MKFFFCSAGNILTDCAADYLEKLYLCRNDNLLKYYLNIPQAMNWFKEILDGSWLSPSPSGRCTIEYQSPPDDEGTCIIYLITDKLNEGPFNFKFMYHVFFKKLKYFFSVAGCTLLAVVASGSGILCVL